MAGSDSVFTLVPRRRLIGLSFGAMQSARRGAGSDILGSRPYVRGDDVRAIDWASSARLATARNTDEFVVRERHADEAPRVILVCDHRPSMSLYAAPLPWLSKPRALHEAAQLIVSSAREVAERREANERRLASLIGRLRDFEIEPVLVSSDEPLEILYSFLEWSDWRKAARRRSW